MVANCILTRCPNQYGVFDFPLGFILRFFHGIFCRMEIEGFMQEWEAAGFAKFYKDRQVIWIRSKWKRAGRPGENHWKGLNTHLEAYPEVRKDFLSLYEPHWRGIGTPSKGDTHPPVNSESESESDKKKTDMSPTSVADGSLFPGKKKQKKLSRDHTDWLKSDKAQVRVVGYFVDEYLKLYGFKPQLEFKSVFSNASTLLKRGMSEKLIREKIDSFLAIDPEKTDDYTKKIVEGHLWKMFIKHVDRIKAKMTGRKDPRAAMIERMSK